MINALVEDDENWFSPSDNEFLSRCPSTAGCSRWSPVAWHVVRSV